MHLFGTQVSNGMEILISFNSIKKPILMPVNFYMYFVVALIPMVVGFIYYHPAVVGNAWMKANNFTAESLKGGNMAVIFIVSYIFSVFLAFSLSGLVIHQTHLFSLFMPEVMESGSAVQTQFNDLMAEYGARHRSFKHGVIHGVIDSIIFVLPIIGINALFERRGWKYIFIHFGYWVITLAVMGGILAQTLRFPAMS